MTWKDIEANIISDFNDFFIKLRDLAPYNSNYISVHEGKVVDYIFVGGKRVRTNSNKLFQNINKVEEITANNGKTLKVVVDTSNVPYYSRAVLEETRTVARHYGRTEYGDLRYGSSREYQKKNDNYLYYMKGQTYLAEFINKWNNTTFEVVEGMGGKNDNK